MNYYVLAFLLFFSFVSSSAQEAEPIIIGSKHSHYSEVLEEERTYWLSLPESYHQENASHKTYPLLILLDGNIHFKPIAGIVTYLSSDTYRSLKIPEMIVIGIQNVDRRRDYTPDKVVTVRANNSGGGDQFLRYVEEELIPDLEQTYRTNNYRILYGHSLGGLLTAHAYLKENTLFKAFMSIDPSFGTWDEKTMDQKVEEMSNQAFERYLYIASANWGKRNIRNRDRHVRFYESLHSKCVGPFPATWDYFENENHASVPPIAFLDGISTIFEGYGISYRDVEEVEVLIEHFERISNRLHWNFSPPEQLVNRIGNRFLRSREQNEQAKALDFFTLNTKNYPKSASAFNRLGGAYERLGNQKMALEHFKKSLELNPDNDNLRSKIEKLRQSQ